MSDPNSWQQMFHMLTGYWTSQAIYVAAKLQLADHLADGPRAAKELAAVTGVAPGPLYRVLRALVSVGVFAQEGNGQFRLNPRAEFLREGNADSLRAIAVLLCEEHYQCWGDMLETVRTGATAFDRVHGQPIFAYLRSHPEKAGVFDAAMTGFSHRAMSAMLDAYDLSGIATLADIGGGLGTNLTTALRRYPAMRGLLFDQPHVVAQAKRQLEAAGVANRCTVEGGNFFEAIPRCVNVYMLGNIIHDWDDNHAGLIFDNLRRAMAPGSKLLLVEHVLPAGDGGSFNKLLDLHMMAVTGGLERTEAEHSRLLAAHGFRLTRVVPTAGDVSVVEGVPA